MNQNQQKYECASQVNKTTNERIYNRNIPSQQLQPYLDVRAVPTKYSIMPIVDPRADIHAHLNQMPVYSPEKVFNPGNSQGPWSGYASAINTESELRSQIYALQSCPQATYVPSSRSDLYTNMFQPNAYNNNAPFQDLFKEERFEAFNPNPENIGKGLFNNCTRQELKNLTPGQSSCP